MSEFIMCCDRCGFRADWWGSKCDELEAKLEAMRTSVKELGSTETAVSANLNAAFATVRRHTRSMRQFDLFHCPLCIQPSTSAPRNAPVVSSQNPFSRSNMLIREPLQIVTPQDVLCDIVPVYTFERVARVRYSRNYTERVPSAQHRTQLAHNYTISRV